MAVVDPVSATIAGAQGALGIIQTLSAQGKIKKLLAKRTAFQTPDEIFKLLNLSLSGAQGDTITRDFQVNQMERALGQAVGTATRLGANPNDLSLLFDQKLNGLLKVGQEFHASNMDAMSKVLSAYNIVASNKAAEWSSQQDIIKDQLQAAAADKAAGVQNIGSAAQGAISLSTASRTANLYKDIAEALELFKKSGGATGAGADSSAHSRYIRREGDLV